eukprot:gene11851-13814_t
MSKIAVISDIHSNLPALKAVLKDIEAFGAQHIYCLGDLTDAAPWHNEVIDLIRSLAIPTLMGNHDERIALDFPVLPLSKHSPAEQKARLAAINFTKSTITNTNRQFLAELPASIRFQFQDSRFMLVHGSPISNDEYLYEDHNPNVLLKMMEEYQTDVLITGHTHLSYIRELQGTDPSKRALIINTGSVGRTKEKDQKASYLQLNLFENDSKIQASIRKVKYNVMETVQGIKDSPVPNFYADFLLAL